MVDFRRVYLALLVVLISGCVFGSDYQAKKAECQRLYEETQVLWEENSKAWAEVMNYSGQKYTESFDYNVEYGGLRKKREDAGLLWKAKSEEAINCLEEQRRMIR